MFVLENLANPSNLRNLVNPPNLWNLANPPNLWNLANPPNLLNPENLANHESANPHRFCMNHVFRRHHANDEIERHARGFCNFVGGIEFHCCRALRAKGLPTIFGRFALKLRGLDVFQDDPDGRAVLPGVHSADGI